jgi:hypothetical protein
MVGETFTAKIPPDLDFVGKKMCKNILVENLTIFFASR